jgi:hypothetical protein
VEEDRMIESVTIYFSDGSSYFQVGKYIVKDKIQTDIEVKKITAWFGVIRIYLSNKQVMAFHGLPYMIQKG